MLFQQIFVDGCLLNYQLPIFVPHLRMMNIDKLFILAVILLTFTCKSDTKSNDSGLEGTWYVERALRNNKETKTLSSGYFEFTDSTVYSNIFMQDDKAVPYEYSDDELIILSAPSLKFQIKEKYDSTFVLRGKMGVFDLEMLLRKSLTPLQMEETLPTEESEL